MIGIGLSQMFAFAKLAKRSDRVKPERRVAARNQGWLTENQQPRAVRRDSLKRIDLNYSNRRMRTRLSGGVGGVRSAMIGPYPD